MGLLIAFVLPAPVAITDEKLAAYQSKSSAIDSASDALARRLNEFDHVETVYYSERGWFPWWASEQQKKLVAGLKHERDRVAKQVQEHTQRVLHAERSANQELGLFSSFGISQAKQNFWGCFERAKVIGRRNTFIDGVWAIIFNRDNELMDIVVKLAVYLVLNMSTAMFVMFWMFLAGLPRFIWTFGGSWYESAAFFLLAAIAAASVMVTFIGLLAGAAGGATYGLMRVSGRTARIERTADGRRQLHGQSIPGYSHVNFGGQHYYRAQAPASSPQQPRPAEQPGSAEQHEHQS